MSGYLCYVSSIKNNCLDLIHWGLKINAYIDYKQVNMKHFTGRLQSTIGCM